MYISALSINVLTSNKLVENMFIVNYRLILIKKKYRLLNFVSVYILVLTY
jgi:hypothetical protein